MQYIFCPECMKNHKLYLGTRVPSNTIDFLCLNCGCKFSSKQVKFFDLGFIKKVYCVECPYSESVPHGILSEVLYCTETKRLKGHSKRLIGNLQDNPERPSWCPIKGETK